MKEFTYYVEELESIKDEKKYLNQFFSSLNPDRLIGIVDIATGLLQVGVTLCVHLVRVVLEATCGLIVILRHLFYNIESL